MRVTNSRTWCVTSFVTGLLQHPCNTGVPVTRATDPEVSFLASFQPWKWLFICNVRFVHITQQMGSFPLQSVAKGLTFKQKVNPEAPTAPFLCRTRNSQKGQRSNWAFCAHFPLGTPFWRAFISKMDFFSKENEKRIFRFP
jgi:hypothetical protein